MTGRRAFIAGASSLAVSFALRGFAAPKGPPRLRLGILSDLHISDEASTAALRRALADFRDRGADAVVVAGDISDWGITEQLVRVGRVWRETFPGNRGADGRPVAKLFVMGNHDVEGWLYDSVRRKLGDRADDRSIRIAADFAASWRQAFGEEFAPISIREVNGYRFVLAHFQSGMVIKGLGEFFGRHAAELRGPKPFFFIQHLHPKGTCVTSCPHSWGCDYGESTAILSAFPQAIALTGHSHTPINDGRTVWRGAFTSVGCGSLGYLIPMGGRDNSPGYGEAAAGSLPMAAIDCASGKQGRFMTVYDGCAVLENFEYVHGEKLGDDEILVFDDPASLTWKARAAAERAPRFPADAIARAEEVDGANRRGDPMRQVRVAFPSCHAYDYEVTAHMEEDAGRLSVRRVYAPKFFLGPKHDVGEVECRFPRSELPVLGRVRFEIRPCGAFGARGEPLVVRWEKASGK